MKKIITQVVSGWKEMTVMTHQNSKCSWTHMSNTISLICVIPKDTQTHSKYINIAWQKKSQILTLKSFDQNERMQDEKGVLKHCPFIKQPISSGYGLWPQTILNLRP